MKHGISAETEKIAKCFLSAAPRMIAQMLYLALLHVSLKVLPNVYQHIYSRCRSHQVWRNLRRRYVLVADAGCSIGQELAIAFAENGMRVVLAGRDEARLQELCCAISKHAECHVHVVGGRSSLSFVDGYDVGILVNCAAAGDEHPAYFVEQSAEEASSACLLSTILLTKRVLANMMESRHGYVLNIGTLADAPSPLFSASGCSAHALKALSDSLYYELETYNINVEYVRVGQTSEHSSLFAPSACRLAEAVLSTFGSGRMSVPYIPHFLQYLLILCIPSALLGRMAFYRNQQIMNRAREDANLVDLKTK